MRRSIVVMCTFLMLFLFKTAVYAESANDVQILTEATQYKQGDNIKFILRAIDSKDLYAADFTINFDPTYLELVNSKFSGMIKLGESGANGVKRYILSKTGEEEGIKGDFNFAEFEFKALKPGSTGLKLSSTKFSDTKGALKDDVKANTQNISIVDKLPVVNVQEIKLNVESYRLKVGEEFTLIPTIIPDNASNKKLIWKSSNADIAKVNDGLVRGMKSGIATITVTTEDGNKTAKCTIEVYNVTADGKGEIKELPQTGSRVNLLFIGFVMLALGTIIIPKKIN